jgi:zinc/manganese transport system substrate-binding protein
MSTFRLLSKLLALLLLCSVSACHEDAAPPTDAAPARLKVVASFSILADLAANVGGERIALTTLVGPGSDSHAYEPTPADARAVATADVVLVNGLGFEGWIDRLIEASGYRGPVVVATAGITPLATNVGATHPQAQDDHGHATHEHAADTPDPHAWQRLDNARIYVHNIARAFAAADPAGAAVYARNARAYQQRLDTLQRQLAARMDAVPRDRRTVICAHDAFAYLGQAYGLTFLSPRGLSTQSEPSARDVAALITLAREQHVDALFLENISDPRLLDRIAAETGAHIGGTLYSDALSAADGPAPTYLQLMRYNVNALADALQPPVR